MLLASGVAAELNARDVPLLPGARTLAEAGHISGGTRRNLVDLASALTFSDAVDDTTRTLLGDAQTSGGLLMSVSPDNLDRLLSDLEGRTPAAAVIGSVAEGAPGAISID